MGRVGLQRAGKSRPGPCALGILQGRQRLITGVSAAAGSSVRIRRTGACGRKCPCPSHWHGRFGRPCARECLHSANVFLGWGRGQCTNSRTILFGVSIGGRPRSTPKPKPTTGAKFTSFGQGVRRRGHGHGPVLYPVLCYALGTPAPACLPVPIRGYPRAHG